MDTGTHARYLNETLKWLKKGEQLHQIIFKSIGKYIEVTVLTNM